MRRGTIVAMSEVTLLPTFAFACSYRPPFLRLYLRHLRGLGLPLADEQIEGRYARWSGDGLELRRGEILIFEAGRLSADGGEHGTRLQQHLLELCLGVGRRNDRPAGADPEAIGGRHQRAYDDVEVGGAVHGEEPQAPE